MAALNHGKVLLVVEQEKAALWLMGALENSNRLELVWRARDSEAAIAYLRGTGAYGNRDKYPPPGIIVTSLPTPAATKVLRVARRLIQRPVVVQLTGTHDISQSLKSMSDGADCSQSKPNGRGETVAFVDWLEDWIEMLKAPEKQTARALFKVVGLSAALSVPIGTLTGAEKLLLACGSGWRTLWYECG
jgi:hypothetical protein